MGKSEWRGRRLRPGGYRVPRSPIANATESFVGTVRALGHPTRLAILRHLARAPGATHGEIATALRPFAAATVAQHVATLARADLIRAEGDRGKMRYRLRGQTLRQLRILLGRLISELTGPHPPDRDGERRRATEERCATGAAGKRCGR